MFWHLYRRRQRSSLSCTCLPDAEATTTGDFFVLSVCLEGVLKLWNLTRSVLRQRVQRIVTSKRAVTFFRDSDSDPVRLNCCLPGAESPLKITQSARSVNAHDKRINALAVAPNDKVLQNNNQVKVYFSPNVLLWLPVSSNWKQRFLYQSVDASRVDLIRNMPRTYSADLDAEILSSRKSTRLFL